MPERFQLGEFWLAPRADGANDYWHITWYDPAGRQTRQRSTRTRDFERAKIKLAEYYVAHGARQKEPVGSVILEHVLTRYYQAHAKNLPTAQFSLYAIEHWKRFWKDDTVAQLTPARL